MSQKINATTYKRQSYLPRLPLDGSLDLTYRCNNNCVHCWLWLPSNALQVQDELSFDEIQRIVDEARAMGCQAWSLSGGEPMLRSDFVDIFDYITRRSLFYKLNTNGTLITPRIAQLLKRRGKKMIALYGATAEVHDRVTRNPGSFEATMRGFSYLKEASVGFIVQIVPMRANYFQYNEMLALAQSLSPYYRVGAPWLWLSSCGSLSRDNLIKSQRLDPADVIKLDSPNPTCGQIDESDNHKTACEGSSKKEIQRDDRLFAACIEARRDFHIDPYGQMSFCCFIKDPDLRYDLRQGTFQEAWDAFIPSLKDRVHGGTEYWENCGSCELREYCRWCPVYSYLELGRYSARVDYLCRVAKEAKKYVDEWKSSHIHYYHIAGMTLQVSADFPLYDDTFLPVYSQFRANGPDTDNVLIHHVSSVPSLKELNLGKCIYEQDPWQVYRRSVAWVYLGLSPDGSNEEPCCLAIFNQDHSHGTIYNNINLAEKVKLDTLFSVHFDQIVLARLLAERQAFSLRSTGFLLKGKGLLFLGSSKAVKSTILKMLGGWGEILDFNHIIVRHWSDNIRVHNFSNHGEMSEVSPFSEPLKAIFFLDKARTNQVVLIDNQKDKLAKILKYVIRPLKIADWWGKTLELVKNISADIPAYRLSIDNSDKVIDFLKSYDKKLSLNYRKDQVNKK